MISEAESQSRKCCLHLVNVRLQLNGKEAVDAFTQSLESGAPYDLICMDIMMPEMNGKEALKIIREKEKLFNVAPRDEVKIVMMTALDMAKDVIDAYYNGGCTSYLVKPILKEKVFKMLYELKLITDEQVSLEDLKSQNNKYKTQPGF